MLLSLSLAHELKQHLSLPLGGHELFKRTYYQRAFFAFSTSLVREVSKVYCVSVTQASDWLRGLNCCARAMLLRL